MKTKFITFFGAITLCAFVLAGLPGNASAQDAEVNQAPATNQQDNDDDANDTAKQYDYTAQPGDSYSVLARKAIQTYGIETKTNLSGAQIVFAETGLTQEAGSELLVAGQKIAIAESTVKAWVDKAKALTAEQQNLWNYYVQFVDFNTNKFGEA